MKNKIVIIKLGGSIISHKDSNIAKPNIKNIRNLSLQIQKIYLSGIKIVLVHGAGSFGHPIVKKYDLQNGVKTEEQWLAVAKTELLLNELNNVIVGELVKLDCPAITLVPHSFVIQKQKKLHSIDTKIIKRYLDQNMMPVLFGDVVLDDIIGGSIISGDVLVSSIANKLDVERIVFLSDVDGVFEENPKLKRGANQIKQINSKNLEGVLNQLSVFNSNDVTGEMEGKVRSIRDSLKGIKVVISNGEIPNRLVDIVLGQKPLGTELFFD